MRPSTGVRGRCKPEHGDAALPAPVRPWVWRVSLRAGPGAADGSGRPRTSSLAGRSGRPGHRGLVAAPGPTSARTPRFGFWRLTPRWSRFGEPEPAWLIAFDSRFQRDRLRRAAVVVKRAELRVGCDDVRRTEAPVQALRLVSRFDAGRAKRAKGIGGAATLAHRVEGDDRVADDERPRKAVDPSAVPGAYVVGLSPVADHRDAVQQRGTGVDSRRTRS